MIIQARSVLADITGELTAAGRQLQGMLQCFQYIMGDTTAAIGAKIFRAIIGNLVHKGDCGVDFLPVKTQIRIALVIL